MHKGFIFNEPDGFPLNQQRLETMQSAYSEIFDGLAAMIGDNVIVAGCVVAGNTVSDGWVVLNGTLYPFKGTTAGVQALIMIRDIKTPLTFKNGQRKEVQFNKFVEFGTGAGAIAWSNLTRLSSIKEISEHLSKKDNPHKVTKAQIGLGNLPNATTDDARVSNSEVLATSKMVNNALTGASAYLRRHLTAADCPPDNTEDITSFLVKEVIVCKMGKYVSLTYRLTNDNWSEDSSSLYLYAPAEIGELIEERWHGLAVMGADKYDDTYGEWHCSTATYIKVQDHYCFHIKTNSKKGYSMRNISISINAILK